MICGFSPPNKVITNKSNWCHQCIHLHKYMCESDKIIFFTKRKTISAQGNDHFIFNSYTLFSGWVLSQFYYIRENVLNYPERISEFYHFIYLSRKQVCHFKLQCCMCISGVASKNLIKYEITLYI